MRKLGTYLAGDWILSQANFNQSDQRTIRRSRRSKTFFPSRKAFSAVLCYSFNEEILSSSDITVAIAASTLNSLGAAIVVFEQQQQLHLTATPKNNVAARGVPD